MITLQRAASPCSAGGRASRRGPSRADLCCRPQAQRGAGLAAAMALHRPLSARQGAAAARPEVHRHAEKEGAGPRLQPPHPEGPEVSLPTPRCPWNVGLGVPGEGGQPPVSQDHVPVGTPARGARLSFLSEVVSVWGDRTRSQPPGSKTQERPRRAAGRLEGLAEFLAMSGRLGHEEAHTRCLAM